MSVNLSSTVLEKDNRESNEEDLHKIALTKRAQGLHQFYWGLRARGLPTIGLEGLANETMISRIEGWLHSTDFLNLKILCLSGNGLTFIPEQIARFKNLTWLNLSFNHIEDLHDSMEELTQLEHLDITQNNFRICPKVISKLVSLKYIYKDKSIGSSQILGPNPEKAYFLSSSKFREGSCLQC